MIEIKLYTFREKPALAIGNIADQLTETFTANTTLGTTELWN